MTAEDPGAANMVATHRKTFSAAVADGLKDAITSGGLHVGNVPLDKLTQDPDNPKTHTERNYRAIAASLSEHGQVSPLVVQCSTGIIIAGNATALSMVSLGMTHADVVMLDVDDRERRKLAVRLNRTSELGGWDAAVLAEALEDWDGAYDDLWDEDEALALFDPDGSGGPDKPRDVVRLVDQFGAPPFNLLDSRQGYWQARKRAWWSIGLSATAGREQLVASCNSSGADYMQGRGGQYGEAGGSAFDPVLAELSFRWFMPAGGHVLDPFAGEAVKGVVAGMLGYSYTGVEVRPEQVEVNRSQWAGIAARVPADEGEDVSSAQLRTPTWLLGDSALLEQSLPEGAMYDGCVTSPPYYDLEVYSDQSDDGSTLGTYEEFMRWYEGIFSQVVDRLRPGSFVVVKVGDVRDKVGALRGFVADNVIAFRRLGLHLYNDAILATPAGTAPLRAGKAFRASRKLCRVHQSVLVFWKGDPRKVNESLGDLPALYVDTTGPDDDAG